MPSKKNVSPVVLATRRIEKVTLSFLERSVLRIEIDDKADLSVSDVQAIQPVKAEMTGNQPHYVLFVTPRFGNLSREAREFSASPEANINALAKAVVAGNLGMRLLSNFFISVNKPPVPHKVFYTQAEAFEWLVDLGVQSGKGYSVVK